MTRWILFTLAATVAFSLSAPNAQAIDFGLGLFKRKSKTETPNQTGQLIATLANDPDVNNRKQAAAAMKNLDPRGNAEVIPALIRALQKDPAPEVRSLAAESIGRLKPVYQPAGLALEAAQGSDPAESVREAAKSALWQYHLNGYRASNDSQMPNQTAEPPFAVRRIFNRDNQPSPSTQPPQTPTQPVASNPQPRQGQVNFRPISNTVGKGVFYQQTAEPPLAKNPPKTTVQETEPQVPSQPTESI